VLGFTSFPACEQAYSSTGAGTTVGVGKEVNIFPPSPPFVRFRGTCAALAIPGFSFEPCRDFELGLWCAS